ncbi:hypothetical protein ASD65_01015 [Microbacterium sp. Root61]|uniref:hypothetical protein n=1 Tax=Microbacterium sp. Root61 TaxID=1736570 RepID=UPI0006FA971A|nr:hypothetical protein [Microbacterium sp. Root61]KRA23157.1 hypothetical protein ASD65_01015 [Microbacterium sp. Root61]
MPVRPSLFRSLPYWFLLSGSIVSAVLGGALVFTNMSTMIATLTDQTATSVEVYGGQSWVVIGSALLAVGLFGVITTLALAVVSTLIPASGGQVLESIAWADDDLDDIDTPVKSVVDAPVTADAATEVVESVEVIEVVEVEVTPAR